MKTIGIREMAALRRRDAINSFHRFSQKLNRATRNAQLSFLEFGRIVSKMASEE